MVKSLLKDKIAEIIRDSTHNLVISENNELDNEIYFTRLKYFIGLLEGYKNGAYIDGILNPDKKFQFISVVKFYSFPKARRDKLWKDSTDARGKLPITTVGIGANIALKETWNKFDILLRKPGLMEQVYYGKEELKDEQVDIIFRNCIEERLTELHKIYGSNWLKLRANERITILSLYFNTPKLANEGTNFKKHIHNYILTNDQIHLERAVEEVVHKSNPERNAGIQNRRNAEGVLLASFNCPTYTKPSEFPDSVKLKVATINKTIIPISINDSPANGINFKYFIWRTKMDQKVRDDHIVLEGKVFRKDNPPGYMPGTICNCRCYFEKVSDYILINDEIAKSRAFELYLRKGIQHPILFIN